MLDVSVPTSDVFVSMAAIIASVTYVFVQALDVFASMADVSASMKEVFVSRWCRELFIRHVCFLHPASF
jgi:hypothetical protein